MYLTILTIITILIMRLEQSTVRNHKRFSTEIPYLEFEYRAIEMKKIITNFNFLNSQCGRSYSNHASVILAWFKAQLFIVGRCNVRSTLLHARNVENALTSDIIRANGPFPMGSRENERECLRQARNLRGYELRLRRRSNLSGI